MDIEKWSAFMRNMLEPNFTKRLLVNSNSEEIPPSRKFVTGMISHLSKTMLYQMRYAVVMSVHYFVTKWNRNKLLVKNSDPIFDEPGITGLNMAIGIMLFCIIVV